MIPSTDDAELDRILEFARDASRRAGEVLLEHFGRLDEARLGRKSSSRDLVTEVDLASERVLVELLRDAYPDHAIEAEEETRDAPDDDRPRWFLDPLDGTVNYVHELPAFCVSMGLYAGLEPLVGVVHAPLLGETFFARRGGGAWVVGRTGEPRRLRVRDTQELGEAVLATGFPYRRNELPNNNLANFDRVFPLVRGVRRFGSAALDLAWVAAGRLDGYWEQHLGRHDLAAGALLVLEAGGVVQDLAGGDEWLAGGDLLVAGPGLAPRLAQVVSRDG